jgi:signal transduction histidine kinase
MAALRIDLVFSYWIYIWFVLYIFKYTSYSPKFALTLGVLDNIVLLFLMFIWGTSVKTIIWFVIINTLIKVVPLYYLRSEPYKIKDIYFTAGLFFIYIIWLHINNQSLVGNIKIIHNSLLYGKNETPFMNLLSKIETNFKTLEVI